MRSVESIWLLWFLYPLATLLVILSLQSGSLHMKFGRDWPYAVGGPIGSAVWWIVAEAGKSWQALLAGYLGGAVVCGVLVAALHRLAGYIGDMWR
ncbi:MAG TPA: hypothetical protein DHW63_08415 [Hyphomonadaceae bacterium]|nr:hypothetical protein [Hyphomonadaceae bacterium]